VQRICKYPLLLRELLKTTPEDHVDYHRLREAYATIEKTVEMVNETSKSSDNLRQIQEVESSLSGCKIKLIAPGRELLLSRR
jgi:RhoGEF domain